MQIIKEVKTLKTALNEYRRAGRTIGFTPTMGALHLGHISLISQSIKDCDISVCSIFINPTQFNEKSDLIKYPRRLDKDASMLQKAGLDIIFAPSEEEIYPADLSTTVNLDFKGLDEAMEGEFRPGHFKGVAQVVKRLLDIIQPTKLYMGQKDFQQFTIIGYMIDKLKINTELVVCPIIREENGLAMSSRNLRLTEKQKKDASIIHKTLLWTKNNLFNYKVSDLEKMALKKMSIQGFRPEYFEIINGRTLKSINYVGNCKYVVACTAVWAGEVRLIDNMILRKQ